MYKKVFSALWGASKSDFLAKTIEPGKRYLVITESYHLEKLYNELLFFLSDKKVLLFPPYAHEPFEKSRILPQLAGERLSGLLEMLESNGDIFLTSTYGLAKLLPPKSVLTSSIIDVAKGKQFDRDELIYYLDYTGYVQVEIVTGMGEFSYRGDIVDIFPVNAKDPLRVEFFDNEIEKISYYDTQTQKRIKEVASYRIIPATEGIYEDLDLKKNVGDDKVLEKIELYGKFAGHHWYAPYVYGKMESIFDYLSSCEVIFVGDSLEDEISKFYGWLEDCALEYGASLEMVNLNFLEKDRLIEKLNSLGVTKLTDIITEGSVKCSSYKSSSFIFPPNAKVYGNLAKLAELVLENKRSGIRTVVSVESDRFRESIKQFMKDYAIDVIEIKNIGEVDVNSLFIYPQAITGGFIDTVNKLYMLRDEEIFGFVKKGKKKQKQEVFRTSITDLEKGDYVVHVDYGIGIFRGLESKTIGGIAGDYILIEYEGGELLYVPLENISLIQKYIGAADRPPKINSLNSVKWKKLKEQAEKSAKRIAIDLLKLYAERKAKKGFPFIDDGELLREVEASFEYDETEDQLAAIKDVLRDMESDKAMDRLICGDVGFGKTEVAVRAACKCCASNKQVAVLAPTTILVKQHYETFKKRFKGTPIRIEYISRFKTRKEISDTLNDVASGKVDILIGTHRLLSDDVVFNDLGLLIIDEEQRFGVAHKEKIKSLRAGIDVLAMSATPIPRTLQLSLAGVRDISVIETAPEDRLPVITNIINNDDEVKKAILHELKRGGQVYYLFNDLKKIQEVAYKIKSMLVDATVEIAHGQMDSRKVENILDRFYSGEVDVLVASTIIENGIDVPNVNTIIIDNADSFGLSQLYQLKGRVGRSDRRGYCYLFVRNMNSLSIVARKRIKIIQQMSELGSGFKIASYDLQLRGAGEILGAEQSGHISTIGYELYIQMIHNAVQELQGMKEELLETEIQSALPYFIPANYIVDPSERMGWYARIGSEEDLNIEGIEQELASSYGEVPESVVNLLFVMKIKRFASHLKIKKVVLMGKQFRLFFEINTIVSPTRLLEYLKMKNLKGNFGHENIFTVTTDNPLTDCLELLQFVGEAEKLSVRC